MKTVNKKGEILVDPNLDDLKEQQAEEHLSVEELLELILLEQRRQTFMLSEISGLAIPGDEDLEE
jgi:hypothetical protein